jgi:flavin-dependent dehydrogenase
MLETADHTDVFIAGAGPAGLAAAIAARRRGFRVTAADRSAPPIDKACGEGLMPEGLAALKSLGISIDPAEGRIFRGIRFCQQGGAAEAQFPDGYGLGIRRPRLHSLLVRHAEQLGVQIRWGTRVHRFDNSTLAMDGRPVRCRWIVGADGQSSAVRAWAGLDSSRTSSLRFGFRRHFRVEPWTDHVEVHWGEECQVYVTPVDAGEICVALIARDKGVHYDRIFTEFPEVARRLQGAQPGSAIKGAVTVTRSLDSVVRDRVALIGEASGSVDAITGEGMALAFQQASVLADALESGELAEYQAAHRRIGSVPAGMARLMLQLDRRPWFRRRVLRALEAEPLLFPRLLAIHVGALRPLQFGIVGAASLAWQFLTA